MCKKKQFKILGLIFHFFLSVTGIAFSVKKKKKKKVNETLNIEFTVMATNGWLYTPQISRTEASPSDAV